MKYSYNNTSMFRYQCNDLKFIKYFAIIFIRRILSVNKIPPLRALKTENSLKKYAKGLWIVENCKQFENIKLLRNVLSSII